VPRCMLTGLHGVWVTYGVQVDTVRAGWARTGRGGMDGFGSCWWIAASFCPVEQREGEHFQYDVLVAGRAASFAMVVRSPYGGGKQRVVRSWDDARYRSPNTIGDRTTWVGWVKTVVLVRERSHPLPPPLSSIAAHWRDGKGGKSCSGLAYDGWRARSTSMGGCPLGRRNGSGSHLSLRAAAIASKLRDWVRSKANAFIANVGHRASTQSWSSPVRKKG